MTGKQAAAAELLSRRERRASLLAWSTYRRAQYGQVPAQHHRLLLDLVQKAIDGLLVHSETGNPCRNLIVLMPPGSAKSTYISIDTPPWYFNRKPGNRILACSYAADLIESFSRECRNTVKAEHKVLGYNLSPDSTAVHEWSTTNRCTYRCAGVGAGISGRRADLGYIDDYIGTEEDADSKTVRDKQWTWYNGDFWPRLKPDAVQIIVANRRHEEDLVGRLIEKKGRQWVVVKIGFFPKENDSLGRLALDKSNCLGHVDFTTVDSDGLLNDPLVVPYLDTRLWPEYFTRQQAADVLLLPARQQAGLYGQEPAPEEGNYFKRNWLVEYSRDELDELLRNENVRIYGAGDWAVSEEKDANRTCFGGCAVDEHGNVFILPDIFWKTAGPKEVAGQFLSFVSRRKPMVFWSESGHISKAWGPFIKEMMLEQQVYAYIEEVTPSKAKDIRARSIQGMMSLGRVRFPAFAHWWPDAVHELLTFPGGKTDDFVDFIAHLGMGIMSMRRSNRPKTPEVEELNVPFRLTMKDLRKTSEAIRRAREPRYNGR